MIRFVLIVSALLGALGAGAEEQRFGAPSIQFGAAAERPISRDDTVLQLRLSLSGMDGSLAHFATVYGRVSGVVSSASLDLRFVPLIVGRTDEEGEHLGLRALPVQLSRSVPLDEKHSVRVDLVGLQAGLLFPFRYEYDPGAIAFLNLTLDMIGYKGVDRIGRSRDFHGMNLSAARIEAGLMYRVSETLRARMSLGAENDASLGFRGAGKAALHSRGSFFAQVRADIQDFAETWRLSVFAEGAADATIETGTDLKGDLRVTGGMLMAF